MMYKLMIVEDEPLIRAGLLKYFDWNELGVDRIVEAANGSQGVSVALQERPDLIISDIRMPEMNGLEMIAILRNELPDCIYVILSGHEDFAYAQQAIRLGVSEYLLKPLQLEESSEVMRECFRKVEQLRLLRFAGQTSSEEATGGTGQTMQTDHSAQTESWIFPQIEAFIVQHISQDVSLQTVADHFFYNPAYLSRLFKSKLDQNYVAFVTKIRMDHAKKYLKQSRYSIVEIGEMCGYKSYKHFVKTFKKWTAMTPSDYRKRLGETI